MKLFILLVFIIATLGFSLGEIGGDVTSTMKIINRLCIGFEPSTGFHPFKDEPGIAEGFYGCYNKLEPFNGQTGIPGAKAIFDYCQTEVFGGTVHNLEKINQLCEFNILKLKPALPLAKYSNCLTQAFRGKGLPLSKATEIVNKCQAGILGVD